MSQSGSSEYKYSCRKCPIRNRCVAVSDNAPYLKSVIRIAFENQTDTLETWGHLQKNCLLVKAEQEKAQASRESLLSRRLRQIRETKQVAQPKEEPAEMSAPEVSEVTSEKGIPAKTPFTTGSAGRSSVNFPPPIPPVSGVADEIRDPDQVTRTDLLTAQARAKPHRLMLFSSGRHISLPWDGELILGRFDPNFGLPPDVDLTYEDATLNTVSRRHARLIARQGLHTIEDMGSKSGIRINGRRLMLGEVAALQTGAQLGIGSCDMVYDLVPEWVTNLGATQPMQHWLMVCATGQRVKLYTGQNRVIGRSDRYIDFVPDIDLDILGPVARKVSRRHAHLVFKAGDNRLYLEDMGSGFGTKVNGELVMLGENRLLLPGDHIWLGGCVLAYDVTLT